MLVLTLFASVRFRAGQGEAAFYDPFNRCFADNGRHAGMDEGGKPKGSWVTLEAGTELAVVAAYGKGSTYCLVVNEYGDGLKSEDAYGLVVRELSMQKILAVACTDAEDSAPAEVAA
jgi:hypothetical protein